MVKRFKYNEFSRCIKDTKTGYIYSDLKEIEKLLNEKSEVEQVLEKYGILNAKKLDQVLFNQRVW